ncbi:MAG: glycoside hydrolase family 3 protein [Lysobacteraceae bacterium]|nr:MAG: glycoside hydrolase family 3 protein [Xanthomonadaceae bacterium]
MGRTTRTGALGALCAGFLLVACTPFATRTAGQDQVAAEPPLQDWPRIESAIAPDPATEARVRGIVAGMTLAQKVGQMTQAEIKSITPEEVRQYYIGSVLNGGGSWPAMDMHATVGDWLTLADRYRAASMSTDASVPIPVIWGTDAVHGHSNVHGATIFPHNIGLGAAHDVALVERIGAATAQSVRATGIDWVFAPTVAVAQDTRWGRSYESFSSGGGLVRDYAEAYVRGLQGGLDGDDKVVATAKHYIGDGATRDGKDQGVAQVDKATMLNVHAQGYYGALGAGVQTVMASYNSWNDIAAGVDYGKMHGSRELLTVALKDKMGFDGFVVSDWNGIGQVPGCTNAGCAQAINAGIDMVMVPDDWKAFIANTIAQVEAGEIPMGRIDDAVTRILRVKLRAGLFDAMPSDSRHAGNEAALQHRELSRRAVRESLVLLKNDGGLLPLPRDRRVLVVGRGADSVPMQAGGWSLTWQGTDTSNADYPNATTILDGIRAALGEDNVAYGANGVAGASGDFDAVIAVIGESPYAETNGDIVASDNVAHSRRHPEDLALLQEAAATGKPVVVVFLSGRPLYTNDLMNMAQAFVAAWLPGTEGAGVADMLFTGPLSTGAQSDFRGTLTFPWPGQACPPASSSPDPARPPLFPVGYGLRLGDREPVGTLPVDIPAACAAASTLAIFNRTDVPPFTLQLSADGAIRGVGSDLNAVIEFPRDKPAMRVETMQINLQQDARRVTWLAPAQLRAINPSRNNLAAFAQADGALQFDVVVETPPTSPVILSMGCGTGCGAELDLAATLRGYAPGTRHGVTVPLACFAAGGLDLAGVEVPFAIKAAPPFAAGFTNIRIAAGAATAPDALACR